MDRGLRAPLSIKEEIALRRVANGVGEVGRRQAERLVQLALVERGEARLRVTEIGLRRLGLLAATLADRQPAGDRL